MIHFISGLPRSGSTLLASILNQNPACSASIMSPVGRIVSDVHQAMGPSNEADSFVNDEQRRRVLRGIVHEFYLDNDHSFVFDNNRRWTANIALLDELFPDSRVICCLRAPVAIVDSFERLHQEHPLSLSVIHGGRTNTTVYERVNDIMGPQGVLGFALNGFRSAFYGPYRDKLVGVLYDNLCRFPSKLMADLEQTLGIPPWKYDFEKIEQVPGAEQFDRDINAPGLHRLKPQVVYEQRASILPPDLLQALPPPFWEVKEGATIAR